MSDREFYTKIKCLMRFVCNLEVFEMLFKLHLRGITRESSVKTKYRWSHV